MMRAHFAVPHLTTKKGFPVSAIKGSINIVESLYRRVRPSHVSFVFDRKEKTHRHRIFKAYKGTRKRDPKVAAIVKPQRRPLYDLLTAMGIYVLHIPVIVVIDLGAFGPFGLLRDLVATTPWVDVLYPMIITLLIVPICIGLQMLAPKIGLRFKSPLLGA